MHTPSPEEGTVTWDPRDPRDSRTEGIPSQSQHQAVLPGDPGRWSPALQGAPILNGSSAETRLTHCVRLGIKPASAEFILPHTFVLLLPT